MGILNVTPDSFSDGGEWFDHDARRRARRELIAQGADILDVGGESTRPGAEPVPRRRGAARVVPVVEALRGAGAQIIVDTVQGRGRRGRARRRRRPTSTTSPRFAATPRWPASSPTRGCDVCLMHMLGEPRTMQDDPRYDDVVDDVKAFLEERVGVRGRARASREERIDARPGHRLRQDARAQPRAAAPPRRDRRARPAGRRRAPRASRSSAGSRAATTRTSGSPATVATNVLALERGAQRLPRPRRRRDARCARGGRCYVAPPMAPDRDDDPTTSSSDEDYDEDEGGPQTEVTSRSPASRSTPTTASPRPSARSASASSSTCASRSARSTRRSPTSSRTPSTTARSASASRSSPSSAPTDARAPVLGDRRPAARRLRRRGGVGQGAKPEPPIPLPVEEVSVEVWRARRDEG